MFTAITTKARLAGLAALAVVGALPVAAGATPFSASLNLNGGDVSAATPFSVSFGSTINPTSQASSFTGVNAYSYASQIGSLSASTSLNTSSPVAFTSSYTFSLTGDFYEKANLILGPNGAISSSGLTFAIYEKNGQGKYVLDNNLFVSHGGSEVDGYLHTGAYELVVSGVSSAGKVASFSGNLAISQAPIPAALPLFGSALVVAGLMGRRRQQQAKA